MGWPSRYFGQINEQRLESIGQGKKLPVGKAADRPLQSRYGLAAGCVQQFSSVVRREQSDRTQVLSVSNSFNPAACIEFPKYVTYGRSLHAQRDRQTRSRNAGFRADTGQRTVCSNWSARELFKLSIHRAHPIDQRARRQQRASLALDSRAVSHNFCGRL